MLRRQTWISFVVVLLVVALVVASFLGRSQSSSSATRHKTATTRTAKRTSRPPSRTAPAAAAATGADDPWAARLTRPLENHPVPTVSLSSSSETLDAYKHAFAAVLRHHVANDCALHPIEFPAPETYDAAESQSMRTVSPFVYVERVLKQPTGTLRATHAHLTAQQMSLYVCGVLQHYFYPSQLFTPFHNAVDDSWPALYKNNATSGTYAPATPMSLASYTSTYHRYPKTSIVAYKTLAMILLAQRSLSVRALQAEFGRIAPSLRPLWDDANDDDDKHTARVQCMLVMLAPFVYEQTYPEHAQPLNGLRMFIYVSLLMEAVLHDVHEGIHMATYDVHVLYTLAETLFRTLRDHQARAPHTRVTYSQRGEPHAVHAKLWAADMTAYARDARRQPLRHAPNDPPGLRSTSAAADVCTDSRPTGKYLVPLPYNAATGSVNSPCTLSGVHGPLGVVQQTWAKDRVDGIPPPAASSTQGVALPNLALQCGHTLSTRHTFQAAAAVAGS